MAYRSRPRPGMRSGQRPREPASTRNRSLVWRDSARTASREPAVLLGRQSRNLRDQLLHHRVGEGLEIVDLQDKGAGTADHILLVVGGQTAGRLGVRNEAEVRVQVDDRET